MYLSGSYKVLFKRSTRILVVHCLHTRVASLVPAWYQGIGDAQGENGSQLLSKGYHNDILD
jgi:hypothetical protein